jgi:hypothetical protein
MMRKELCSTPAVLRVDCFGMRFELADPRATRAAWIETAESWRSYADRYPRPPYPSQSNQRHVNTLIVSGGETDVCVLSTVLSAIDLGLRIVLVEGALCSSFDESHDAILGLYR